MASEQAGGGQRPPNEEAAIGWLVSRVPELGPLLSEHRIYFDELLPYVVFEGDFLRWFVTRVRKGEHESARRFIAAIEPLLDTTSSPKANDPVWNLASICFVEGLVMQGDDDVVDVARPWMGPITTAAVDQQYVHRRG